MVGVDPTACVVGVGGVLTVGIAVDEFGWDGPPAGGRVGIESGRTRRLTPASERGLMDEGKRLGCSV